MPRLESYGNSINGGKAGSAITGSTIAISNGWAIYYPRAFAVGEQVAGVVMGAEIEIEKTSNTTTYAVGADVLFDTATQKSVATGGTKIGRASRASANGDKFVYCRINE